MDGNFFFLLLRSFILPFPSFSELLSSALLLHQDEKKKLEKKRRREDESCDPDLYCSVQ